MEDDDDLTDEEKAKPKPKPLKWIGSSKEDLIAFPDQVRKAMGYALHLAQINLKAPNAKPLRGFGGASILEVVADHDGGTYRAVLRSSFKTWFMCCTPFRRNPRKASKRPSPTSTSSRHA